MDGNKPILGVYIGVGLEYSCIQLLTSVIDSASRSVSRDDKLSMQDKTCDMKVKLAHMSAVYQYISNDGTILMFNHSIIIPLAAALTSVLVHIGPD